MFQGNPHLYRLWETACHNTSAAAPHWNPDHRYQLHKRSDHKEKIGNGIQPCTRGTDSTRLSCNGSIHHIGQSAEYVQPIKADRIHRAKQQPDATKDTAKGYDVCDLLFHRFNMSSVVTMSFSISGRMLSLYLDRSALWKQERICGMYWGFAKPTSARAWMHWRAVMGFSSVT